jgi:hypothetical protein
MSLQDNLKSFIIKWNKKFPIDHWWRKKYNVPFGSKAHREMSLIDMMIDFEEDSMYEELRKQLKEERESSNFDDMPGLKSKSEIKLSEKEEIDEFNNIDLEQFNDAK